MKKDLGADAAAAAAAAASGECPLDRPSAHGVGALVLSMDIWGFAVIFHGQAAEVDLGGVFLMPLPKKKNKK